jgi:hypothetical protein
VVLLCAYVVFDSMDEYNTRGQQKEDQKMMENEWMREATLSSTFAEGPLASASIHILNQRRAERPRSWCPWTKS